MIGGPPSWREHSPPGIAHRGATLLSVEPRFHFAVRPVWFPARPAERAAQNVMGGRLMTMKFMPSMGLGAALAACLMLAPTAFAKDWKTVVIAMEGAYEPWNLTDSSGKIVGFEPDLIMDVCKRAGLECKIIAQDWDGMVPGLKAGKFDVIMDGMSITDERKKEIDFTKPYAVSPGAFLAPKDSPLAKATGAGTLINLDKDKAAGEVAIKSVQAALKGKTLGVQVSTTHANFASQYLKGIATVKEYKTA